MTNGGGIHHAERKKRARKKNQTRAKGKVKVGKAMLTKGLDRPKV